MKIVFIISIRHESKIGYYDEDHGQAPAYSDNPYLAKRFESYSSAEEFLKGMHEKQFSGGMFQIEKFFVLK